MPPRSPLLSAAAAALLTAAFAVPLSAQERGERCYDLRIVPERASLAPAARAADRLGGPVVLTREPAGRPPDPDARALFRVERPGPWTPWTSRGFTAWTGRPDGTIWLGGAAVAVPGGDGAASARLSPQDDGRLRGRLRVELAVGPDGGPVSATLARVTALPVSCDPPEVVKRDRASPQ